MLRWFLALCLFVSGTWVLAMSFTHSYKECKAGRATEYAQPYQPSSDEKVQTFLLCQGESLEANGELITAFGTLFIAFFTWTLWQSTERGGEHFRVTERAYVKMSHHPPGIGWATLTANIRLRIKNFGATPADITDVFFTHLVTTGDDLTDTPPYGAGAAGRLPQQFFLVRDDEFNLTETFVVTPEEKTAIMTAKRLLIALAYVDYIDKFGIRHRSGYARMYDPGQDELRDLFDPEVYKKRNNLPNFPHRLYNYDRPRKPGEGNDWT